jgi:hypothetical protein
LFEDHALRIVDVKRLEIHGGSLRIYATHAKTAGERETVEALLAEEARWGVKSPEFYEQFGNEIGRLRETIRGVLYGLKARGRSVAAYGAAAKGSIFLNTFRLDSEVLDFVADRSTYKQGLFMPGSRLPIHAPEHLLEAMPDYVLLLAWNFADEILAQQAAYRERGGQFIIGVPNVKIV